MKIRIATLVMVAFDTLAWAAAASAYFFSGSDPATKGLDTGAGIIVTALFAATTVPALILVFLKRAPKVAFALALAFPGVFAALFVAAVIWFMV